MKRKKKILIDPRKVVSIVGDGMIAGPERNGIMIPVLVVDATEVPAIGDAIRAAEYEPDGDVETAWGANSKTRNQMLFVNLIRPVPVNFAIEFVMPNYGILVDAIVTARCFYLKAGGPRDNFKTLFAEKQIIVDVPPSEYDEHWPGIYKAALIDDFRRRGLTLAKARVGADEVYQMLHPIAMTRVSTQPPTE